MFTMEAFIVISYYMISMCFPEENTWYAKTPVYTQTNRTENILYAQNQSVSRPQSVGQHWSVGRLVPVERLPVGGSVGGQAIRDQHAASPLKVIGRPLRGSSGV